MRIIMAVDILEGKCVRLTRGDYNTGKIYRDDPLDMALEIEDNGLKYLHLVDLDGARSKKVINHKILEKMCLKTQLTVDFGGGIRSDDDIRIAFDCGAAQVTAGSVAVTDQPLFLDWLKRYGNQKIILGADFKGKEIATHGWMKKSGKDLTDFISDYHSRGIRYVICTDVSRDGMLSGPSTDIYRQILEKVDVDLIASGGISSLKDIEDICSCGCEGVIIGKAVYEGKIQLKELRELC